MTTDTTSGVFEHVMQDLGLEPRSQQTKLVHLLRQTLGQKGQSFVQAGTGVGKSYVVLSTAYEASVQLTRQMAVDYEADGMAVGDDERVPSLVICPTNALIDQYVNKDAPKVAAATGGKFYHIKGRSHYLCTDSFAMAQMGKEAKNEWMRLTDQGEGEIEWSRLGLDSTYGCSGDCDGDIDFCGIHVARARAFKADVVITNGHVLMYDYLLRTMTGGQVRLLPEYGALFVDECHTLTQIARDCMSVEIGPKARAHDLMPELRLWAEPLAKHLTEDNREVAVVPDDQLKIIFREAAYQSRALGYQIQAAKANGDIDGAKMLKKDQRAYQRVADFAFIPEEAEDEDTAAQADRFISTITMEPDKHGELQMTLNRICVDAAPNAAAILNKQPSMLVSGTIPQSLPRMLGQSAKVDDVGTPFDYSKSQLVIGTKRGNDRDAEVERWQQMLSATRNMVSRTHEDGGGGTLILFTSWKEMESVMRYISRNITDVPVFMQGRDRREVDEDLAAFAAHGNAVMGGVQSLWTGIDIPGPALRQVIISRLPYAVPTLEQKAIERIYGKQPYYDAMSTLLVQGIGRLVRQPEDNGRVFIADSRARSQRWTASPLTRHIADFTLYRAGA